MSAEKHRWVVSGGLASGKSAVRELLADAGFTTIDADAIGHRVLQPDGPAFVQVAARWPDVVRDGVIDRSALGAVVFNDEEELAILESMTHPHIFDTIRGQVERLTPPVFVEVPIPTDELGDDWKLIVVDSRDDGRLQRAIQRGMSQSDARSRMRSQPSRRQWLAAADLVIPNHGSTAELKKTVTSVLSVLFR